MKFDFKLPGKETAPPATSEEKPMGEMDGDESGEYTKADLGKMIASAIKSGDGEAIWEAVKKCATATPSDE